MAGALTFIGISLATLPLAGVPFAIWFYLDYRRYDRAHHQRPRLVASP